MGKSSGAVLGTDDPADLFEAARIVRRAAETMIAFLPPEPVDSAAEKLTVTPQTIRNWIRRGILDYEMQGREYFVRAVSLAEALDARDSILLEKPGGSRIGAHLEAELTTRALIRSPKLMTALRKSVRSTKMTYGGPADREAKVRRAFDEADTKLREALALPETGAR